MSSVPVPPPSDPGAAPSIRRRLNLLVLSTGLPAAMFALALLGAGYWVALRAVESSLTAATASLSGALDGRLLRLQTGLQTFALAEEVDPARMPRLRERALAFQQAVDAVNVVVVREDGQQVLNTLLPEDAALPKEPPSAFRQRVLAEQRPIIRDMFRGPVSDVWLAAVGVPARSTTSDRFVLGASLTSSQLRQVLEAQQLPPGWVVAVLDSQGVIAARMPTGPLVGRKAVAGLRDALSRQRVGIERVESADGVDVLAGFHRSASTGWSVAIGIPRDELWLPMLRNFGWMVAAALLALLGSLMLARKLGGRIVNSMTGLSAMARSVGGEAPPPHPPLAFREAVEVAEVLSETDRKLKLSLQEEQRIRDELLRSNLDLQRFAFSASHDMRSPLRTLQGFLSVVASSGDLEPERRQDLLQRCLRAVRQLDHLTGALLAFARLNAEPAEPKRVDLAEVIADVQELLQQSIAESGAVVQVGAMPVVLGVRGELVQLLQNLLANAIQYCKPGAVPDVRVSAEPSPEGWRICVADQGIGIAPEYHQKIFEIFQRLHTQREHAGSGIGLATCARIAARQGGRIWVESAEGQGARFYVTLPGAQPGG